ncbi:MAG TPA: 4-hydroxyphenylpyruvate dioxygenase [Longimicrobiaceae bacterium]|nr:4-hydroxyphenylpyruvate dioxygenase [Longimicrobiaceae bacterium]
MLKIEEEVATSEPRPRSAVQLTGIHHVEMYVGNAYQAAHFYRTAFGFRPVAKAGLATGVRDRTSFAMEQGKIRLVLTSALDPDSPVARHVNRHGDGVHDVAFTVDDVAKAFEAAVSRGARPVMEPTVIEDERGRVVRATIGAFGDTVHSFIQLDGYQGRFLPGFQPFDNMGPVVPTGLTAVDHVAVSLEEGNLDAMVEFYTQVLGFHQSHAEMVWTERSAMNSKVVEDPTGSIKFPMQEPAHKEGLGKSQIDEYLDFHRGSGTQHVAYLTDDIVRAIRAIRGNGIQFNRVPHTYYEALEERVGKLDPELMREISDLGILVDSEEDGTLLQVFSEPLEGRPTFFVEVIERRGAKGFGAGNIKALFESIEREQALRGTL